ncbi:MAG TPA: aspartyl protease family protein [Terriglobales bacterium]|nr:aspartyl protease family protein [Terriglobales bacterium]
MLVPVAFSCNAVAADAANIIPFAAYSNYVWLSVRVNGSRPVQFTLDSGASASVISQRVADEQGLGAKGQRRESNLGTGESAPNVSRAANVTLNLNGIEVRKKEISVVSMDGLESAIGHRIDGILGAEIFRRYVVEIDYANSRITLFDPGDYKYDGAGRALPLEIRNDRPFLRATVALQGAPPVEGLFIIDSGAAGTLSLYSPFVRKHQMLSPIQKTVPHFVHGIAGQAPEMLARADSLRLGPLVIARPDVALSIATRGSTADSSYDGAIGAEVLRRFKVIFDYSRKHVILERTSAGDEPFDVDMSGGSLVAAGPDFKVFTVEHVLENSPMFESGVRDGDVITAIDGRPASEYTLDQLRQMLKKEGQEYRLSVERGGQKLQLKIMLRKLI